MACEDTTIKIIKGTDHTIRAELKNGDCTAFDLSDADSIVASFTTTNGSGSTIGLSDGKIEIVQPPELGAIILNLDDVFTNGLKVGTGQSFEVKVEIGQTVIKVQFKGVLDVIASQIP